MTTATKITLFRVVMIPVFLVCMYLSEIWSWMQIVSCVVFAVASLSDILDGQIARRCNLADKLETLSLHPYSSESKSTTSCMVIPARMICAFISLRTFILKIPP